MLWVSLEKIASGTNLKLLKSEEEHPLKKCKVHFKSWLDAPGVMREGVVVFFDFLQKTGLEGNYDDDVFFSPGKLVTCLLTTWVVTL